MARILALGGFVLFLCGCATLDALTGVNPDGTIDPSGGPLGTGSSLLGSFVPWAGAGLGALGTLYSQIRRKKYADALHSVVSGVHAVRKLHSDEGEIRLTDEKFVAILKGLQESAKTEKIVSKSIDKAKKEGATE